MIFAGTGHRPNKLGNEYNYKGPYTKFILDNLDIIGKKYKPTRIISGLALGFDTILALWAIKNNIALDGYIPFKGQECVWPQSSKDLYYKILKKCESIHIVDASIITDFVGWNAAKETAYDKIKMDNRNEEMVDICDKLISAYDGTPGGTRNCLDYAESVGKQIIYIHINHLI